MNAQQEAINISCQHYLEYQVNYLKFFEELGNISQICLTHSYDPKEESGLGSKSTKNTAQVLRLVNIIKEIDLLNLLKIVLSNNISLSITEKENGEIETLAKSFASFKDKKLTLALMSINKDIVEILCNNINSDNVHNIVLENCDINKSDIFDLLKVVEQSKNIKEIDIVNSDIIYRSFDKYFKIKNPTNEELDKYLQFKVQKFELHMETAKNFHINLDKLIGNNCASSVYFYITILQDSESELDQFFKKLKKIIAENKILTTISVFLYSDKKLLREYINSRFDNMDPKREIISNTTLTDLSISFKYRAKDNTWETHKSFTNTNIYKSRYKPFIDKNIDAKERGTNNSHNDNKRKDINSVGTGNPKKSRIINNESNNLPIYGLPSIENTNIVENDSSIKPSSISMDKQFYVKNLEGEISLNYLIQHEPKSLHTIHSFIKKIAYLKEEKYQQELNIALFYAIQNRHDRLSKLLLKYGADVNYKQESTNLLILCAATGNLDLLSRLLIESKLAENILEDALKVFKNKYIHFYHLLYEYKNKLSVNTNVNWVKDMTVVYGAKDPLRKISVPAGDIHLKLAFTNRHLQASLLSEENKKITDNPVTACITFIVQSPKDYFMQSSQKRRAITIYLNKKNKLHLAEEDYDIEKSKKIIGERIELGANLLLSPIGCEQNITVMSDNWFQRELHHGEQSLVNALEQEDTLVFIVEELRKNNLVAPGSKICGFILDICSPRYVCDNCQLSILGLQHPIKSVFLQKLSSKLVENGFRIPVLSPLKSITRVSSYMPCNKKETQRDDQHVDLLIDLRATQNSVILQQDLLNCFEGNTQFNSTKNR